MADSVPAEEPVLRFRNYEPRSEALQGLAVEKPIVPNIEEVVDAAEVVHNDATQEPLLNLAPKRANWDLKRDLEPHMKRLRGMTDRAIVRLIAQRVTDEQQRESAETQDHDRVDLASAVSKQQQLDAGDDED